MKGFFVLPCLLLTCFIFCGNIAQAAQDSSTEEALMEAIADKEYQKALTLANSLIDKNPENIFALESRINIFLELGEVNKALDDINSLLDKDIKSEGMLIFRCVLRESQAKTTTEVLECYAAEARLLEETYSRNELVQNGDYIRLLILADSPTAEEVRKEYIAYLLATDPGGDELQFIGEFDRSKIKPLIDEIRAAQSKSRDN